MYLGLGVGDVWALDFVAVVQFNYSKISQNIFHIRACYLGNLNLCSYAMVTHICLKNKIDYAVFDMSVVLCENPFLLPAAAPLEGVSHVYLTSLILLLPSSPDSCVYTDSTVIILCNCLHPNQLCLITSVEVFDWRCLSVCCEYAFFIGL